jgi:Ca-activated chloride channel family protein
VDAAHRDAASRFLAYLFEKETQEKLIPLGMRPGLDTIPLKAPLDPDHGVNPEEPRTVIESPPLEVVLASIDLWHRCKKPTHVVLVFDHSQSMAQGRRLVSAQAGAADLLAGLNDQDSFSLLALGSKPVWAIQDVPVKTNRERCLQEIRKLKPQLDTKDPPLYDAVAAAHDHLAKNSSPETMAAIIVLSDAEDLTRKVSLNDLLEKLKAGGQKEIPVYTIAYGAEAGRKVLAEIGAASGGKSFKGKLGTIRNVFKEISTNF